MPTALTWTLALILIADGFLLGLGWIVAQAIYAAVLSVLSRGKAP